jgi:hypothetical protein
LFHNRSAESKRVESDIFVPNQSSLGKKAQENGEEKVELGLVD